MTKHDEQSILKPSEALERNREAIRDAVLRHKVENPRIFGSALTGSDLEGSDLDVLVDPLPGTTLFDLGGLQFELETLLGIKVDLLTPKEIPMAFRAKVLASATPL